MRFFLQKTIFGIFVTIGILGAGFTLYYLKSHENNKDTSSLDTTFHSGRQSEQDTLTLAKQNTDASYEKVAEHGGEIVSLDDGKNYGVWWQPEDFDPTHDVVLVSLPGHMGWASKDFDIWYPELQEHGYAFFGLQYWLGYKNIATGYYDPDEMYAMIRQVLKEKGITPGNVIFQGYSMGSARSYAITAMDMIGDHYFGITISNSGVWEDDYPPNEEIAQGIYGDSPFTTQPWILYCAVNDTQHPDWNKCEKMDETKKKIESYGGRVILYIKDDVGDHGSFMINKENVREALDTADAALQ